MKAYNTFFKSEQDSKSYMILSPLNFQTPTRLNGREALRSELTAALDGVTKQYLVYVLKKNGCVYDFMYIAADFEPGSRAQFEGFVQGFATLE